MPHWHFRTTATRRPASANTHVVVRSNHVRATTSFRHDRLNVANGQTAFADHGFQSGQRPLGVYFFKFGAVPFDIWPADPVPLKIPNAKLGSFVLSAVWLPAKGCDFLVKLDKGRAGADAVLDLVRVIRCEFSALTTGYEFMWLQLQIPMTVLTSQSPSLPQAIPQPDSKYFALPRCHH